MVCAKCGGEMSAGDNFCLSCGQPAERTPRAPAVIDASALDASSGGPPAAAAQPAMDPRLKGVGGWLLLFLFGVTIANPAFLLLEAAANRDDILVVVFNVALAAFCIFVGVSVWRVRPGALALVKALFIVLTCVAALIIVGGAAMLSEGASRAGNLSETLLPGARMLFSIAIWLAYFKKSKRVLATFGRNL